MNELEISLLHVYTIGMSECAIWIPLGVEIVWIAYFVKCTDMVQQQTKRKA